MTFIFAERVNINGMGGGNDRRLPYQKKGK